MIVPYFIFDRAVLIDNHTLCFVNLHYNVITTQLDTLITRGLQSGLVCSPDDCHLLERCKLQVVPCLISE